MKLEVIGLKKIHQELQISVRFYDLTKLHANNWKRFILFNNLADIKNEFIEITCDII